jgi:hypothetical protein
MIAVINSPKQDKSCSKPVQKTVPQETSFINWCQEFNVGIMTSKNSEFTVKIGDHVKHVKLERI